MMSIEIPIPAHFDAFSIFEVSKANAMWFILIQYYNII